MAEDFNILEFADALDESDGSSKTNILDDLQADEEEAAVAASQEKKDAQPPPPPYTAAAAAATSTAPLRGPPPPYPGSQTKQVSIYFYSVRF